MHVELTHYAVFRSQRDKFLGFNLLKLQIKFIKNLECILFYYSAASPDTLAAFVLLTAIGTKETEYFRLIL